MPANFSRTMSCQWSALPPAPGHPYLFIMSSKQKEPTHQWGRRRTVDACSRGPQVVCYYASGMAQATRTSARWQRTTRQPGKRTTLYTYAFAVCDHHYQRNRNLRKDRVLTSSATDHVIVRLFVTSSSVARSFIIIPYLFVAVHVYTSNLNGYQKQKGKLQELTLSRNACTFARYDLWAGHSSSLLVSLLSYFLLPLPPLPPLPPPFLPSFFPLFHWCTEQGVCSGGWMWLPRTPLDWRSVGEGIPGQRVWP